MLKTGKILLLLPQINSTNENSSKISQCFLKMQNKKDIKVEFFKEDRDIKDNDTTSMNHYLICFSAMIPGLRINKNIKIINFIGDDKFELKQLIGSKFNRFDYIYKAYLNVFNKEEDLEKIKDLGFRPDYSRDIILQYIDEKKDYLEMNVQKLVQCLIR